MKQDKILREYVRSIISEDHKRPLINVEPDEHLVLREYVRSIILEEDYETALSASAKQNAAKIGSAAKKFFSVVSGSVKQVYSNLKSLPKGVWEGVKSTLTLGKYGGNYDKVEKEYQKEMQDIANKHGADIQAATDELSSTLAPVTGMAKLALTGAGAFIFFHNPLLFFGAREAYDSLTKNNPKLKQSLEKAKSESNAATKKYAGNVNNQVNQISNEDIPPEILEKLKNETEGKLSTSQDAKNVKLMSILDKVKEDRNELVEKAKAAFPKMDEKTLTGKGSMFEPYDNLIKSIGDIIEQNKK